MLYQMELEEWGYYDYFLSHGIAFELSCRGIRLARGPHQDTLHISFLSRKSSLFRFCLEGPLYFVCQSLDEEHRRHVLYNTFRSIEVQMTFEVLRSND